MRHRKVAPQVRAETDCDNVTGLKVAKLDEASSDEDLGFALMDNDLDDSAVFAGKRPLNCKQKLANEIVYSPVSPTLPSSKRQKMEETGKNMAPHMFFSHPDMNPGTLLQRLIARQSFEGSWVAIDKLPCDEMKLDRDAASKAVAQLTETNADRILATATVVLFLEKKMQDEEETWELVVEKARAWLEGEVAEDVLAQVWQLAEAVIEKI